MRSDDHGNFLLTANKSRGQGGILLGQFRYYFLGFLHDKGPVRPRQSRPIRCGAAPRKFGKYAPRARLEFRSEITSLVMDTGIVLSASSLPRMPIAKDD
jgi:hypothetical protein